MMRGRWRLRAATMLAAVPAAVTAQRQPPPDAPPPAAATPDDIVVTGRRPPGSAIGDVDPVALLDSAAIKALGVTRLDDMLRLLKPLTTATSGADPVFLLNGRRVSGYGEVQGLPPEALERTEILSERDAARFGFPATVRVVNFVTKARYRALSVEEGASTTTDGGGDAATLDLGSTRIAGMRRQSLTIAFSRQDPLPGTARRIAPDAGVAFDTLGNVAAPGGGSIDPALDAGAGTAVTIAPVPADPAARGSLAAYAAAANRPRVTDLSPYQSIAGSTMLKVEGTQALSVGKHITGSLNLTMQAQGGTGLAGLSTAILRLPAGHPASPFARDVLLYRYLVGAGAGALRQRTASLLLHAGGTLQGDIGRWLWTATGGYDRSRVVATVDQGIDPAALQARIDAGGDPFAPPTVADAGSRRIDRNRTVTTTFVGKATATGPLARLPAGAVTMTLTGDYARSTGGGGTIGVGAPLDVVRSTRGASVNVDVPIASAAQGVLAAIGTLSANGTVGVTAVSGYRSLVSGTAGVTWTPWGPVQFNGSIATSQTPPPIAALTNPVVLVPNVPFFDFTTGTSTLVTVAAGGNTGLVPERRRIVTVGIGVKPIRTKELRFNLDYIDTGIRDQAGNLGGATAALQAAFPDRFVRDAAGRLVRVDLRQVTLAVERERKVQARVTLWTQLGREPAPPAKPGPSPSPPPPPPPPRPTLYAFVTASMRLDDRLRLRPGLPRLDLLAGESIDGTGGRPRYEVQPTLGGGFGPVQGGLFATYQSGTRIRGALAAADLRFSAKTYVGLYSTIDAARLAPHARWADRVTFRFQVQNILNDRIAVRDANGATPYRFQPAFLDPYGRIVRLSVRKLF